MPRQRVIYIVRDLKGNTEKATLTLPEARLEALNFQRGEIVRAHLRNDLNTDELRCALYNHSGYADALWLIAEIDGGIARKVEEKPLTPP